MTANRQWKTLFVAAALSVLATACGGGLQASSGTAVQGATVERAESQPATIASQSTDCRQTNVLRAC